MRRWLFVLALIPEVVSAAPALEVGARYLTARVQQNTDFDGGRLHLESSNGFGASAEAFWSERFSTQFSATFIQPVPILLPSAGGNIDLGTLGISTMALTARFYGRTRIAPFAGAGAAVVLPGDLDDRFGEEIEADFDTEQGLAVEGGVRFRKSAKVAFDVTAVYIPLELELHVRRNRSAAQLPEKVRLNPLAVSIGASWRF